MYMICSNRMQSGPRDKTLGYWKGSPRRNKSQKYVLLPSQYPHSAEPRMLRWFGLVAPTRGCQNQWLLVLAWVIFLSTETSPSESTRLSYIRYYLPSGIQPKFSSSQFHLSDISAKSTPLRHRPPRRWPCRHRGTHQMWRCHRFTQRETTTPGISFECGWKTS